jgi:hypothetical protein
MSPTSTNSFEFRNLNLGFVSDFDIRISDFSTWGWTREELPEEDMGLAFFVNAVQYIRNHLL